MARDCKTFAQFWPFYLKEHRDHQNKRMHFFGTSIVIALMLWYTLSAISFSIVTVVGFAIHALCADSDFSFTGPIEFSLILLLFVVLQRLFYNSWLIGIMFPAFGYSFAWAGHKFHEKNCPATFTYPTYSLWADFCLWGAMLIGRVDGLWPVSDPGAEMNKKSS